MDKILRIAMIETSMVAVHKMQRWILGDMRNQKDDQDLAMTTNVEDQIWFDTLQARLRTLLPEEYTGRDVQPVSMGSAGLKFRPDGMVAWNELWATFCDLAMAGGPPHKGALLEPGSESEMCAHAGRYQQVVDEICRGIHLVTGLEAARSKVDGWVRVECPSVDMAGWLARAIAMENVSVHCDGSVVQLPAGPHYRLEREIKNVITVIAKTCHYWRDHMDTSRRQSISDLFEEMEVELPLLKPTLLGHDSQFDPHRPLSNRIAESIQSMTGLKSSNHVYAGWLGIECQSVRAAIWIMRLMVASNLLSRREGTAIFVPLNPVVDPEGEAVVQTFFRIHRFALASGIA